MSFMVMNAFLISAPKILKDLEHTFAAVHL